jgi:hypothetical protein
LLRQLAGVLDEKLSGRINGAVLQTDNANATQWNIQVDSNSFQHRMRAAQS